MRNVVLLYLLVSAPSAFAQLQPGALPLPTGQWEFASADGGDTFITVTEAGEGCLDAVWLASRDSDVPGMRERWCPSPDGVRVAGRGLGFRWTDVATPYVIAPYRGTDGDTWEAHVRPGSRGTVQGEVGPVEPVETPSGRHHAQRVTMLSSSTRVVRWYAQGVGLVREEQALLNEDGEWDVYRDERLVGRSE